ncbi:hypothetical protein BDN72DRAFT_858306 [Pluteus cervinus]|uniref:Uncharacterized protein n=1 Tax=Pluteus cervinus TaxID=181527 RepID=A0ACD3ASU1_9AGAR|nr:hypothetical protein BDN72DRAFT_858306 [Pluteus cervinus]
MFGHSIIVVLNHLSLPPQISIVSIKIEPGFGEFLEVLDQFDMVRAFISSQGLPPAAWPALAIEVFVLSDDMVIILTDGPSGDTLIDTDGEQSVESTISPSAVRTLEVDIFYLNAMKDESQRIRELTDSPGNPETEQVSEELTTQYHNILGFRHLKTLRYYGDEMGNDSQFTWDYYRVLKEWLVVGLRSSKLVFKTMSIPAKDRLGELFSLNGGVVDILDLEDLAVGVLQLSRGLRRQIRLEDLLEKKIGVLEHADARLSHPKSEYLCVIDPIRPLRGVLEHSLVHLVMAPTQFQIDIGMEDRQEEFKALRHMDLTATSDLPSQQTEKLADLVDEKKVYFPTEDKIAGLKTYIMKNLYNSRYTSRQRALETAGADNEDTNRRGSRSEDNDASGATGTAARRRNSRNGPSSEARGGSASSRSSRPRRNDSASGMTTRQGISSPYPTRDRRVGNNQTRATTQLPGIKEEPDDGKEVGTSQVNSLMTFLMNGCEEPLPHFYEPLEAYGCESMDRIREISQWDITVILGMTKQLRTQRAGGKPLSGMDRDRLAHAILRLGQRG